MIETPAPPSVSVGQAFDAALLRGRAAQAAALPDQQDVSPANDPAQTVAELRGMLSARFAHAVPAARAAALHRQAVLALGRIESRLFWRRVRITLADFLMTNWVAIMSVVVIVVLVGLLLVFGGVIFDVITGLFAATPAPPAPATPTATIGPPVPKGPVP